jgi:anti-anti-sigma factor
MPAGWSTLRLPRGTDTQARGSVMGNVARTAAVGVDGGPVFTVEVSSDALRSWVTLCGELDLASAPPLRQVLDQLCGDGFPEIVLDLSRLEFLSAAGLAVLHRADEHLRATGGRLILHRPGRLARRVLAITELDTVLTIQPATTPHRDHATTSGSAKMSATNGHRPGCTSVPASHRVLQTTPSAGQPR